jgi:hypothetical protein
LGVCRTSADARDTSLAQTHGNATNLALKGIIAVQAMSEISQTIGQTEDAQKYEVCILESLRLPEGKKKSLTHNCDPG